MKGRVLRSVGSSYDILGEDKQHYKGRLKGKFKQEDSKLTNPIAVGDRVNIVPEGNDPKQVIIDRIEPRENYIIRKSAHKTEHAHVIASNIDEVYLIVTLRFPETSLGFIDRFLVAAESFRIPASIIFNKTDLYNEKDLDYLKTLSRLYNAIGYPCYPASAGLNTGVDVIKSNLKGKTILFSGHSGVGKSTLMNLIAPNVNQKTLPVSNFANKGVHTTTFAEMFDLEDDTFLIDTPGIKEFGLVEIEDYELSHFFPEMRALIGQCKFNTCLHSSEPGCMVIKAVEQGKIALSRYKSYLSILQNEDNRK